MAHLSVSVFLNGLTRLKCESQTANSDLNDQNVIQPAEDRTPSTSHETSKEHKITALTYRRGRQRRLKKPTER